MKTDWQNVHSKVQEKRKKVTFNTMQIIAFGFLGVIFLGSILLYLPISNQEPIAYLDALFVSVSAVCVTGLVTVFPAAQFTLFGKVVLLGLIQIGGSVSAGKKADIVVFDPRREYQIDVDTFASKGKNTPFDGWEVKGEVCCTLADGKIVYEK